MNAAALARFWIQALFEKGLRDFVVSPGSRSAPLILALESLPGVRMVVHPDERSAGFIALGLARQWQRPVGLICSSGSAGINYGPAIAEAYHQGVGLLVITADRPSRYVPAHEGQTLWQESFFQGFIKGRTLVSNQDPGHPDQTWDVLCQGKPGPVHLNIRFEEPLYEADDGSTVHPGSEPLVLTQEGPAIDFGQGIRSLADLNVPARPRIAILAGHMDRKSALELQPFIREFIAKGGVFWGDVSSHLWSFSSRSDFPFWLWSRPTEEGLPHVLVSMGGSMVPRRWESFFSRFPGQKTLHVDLFEQPGYRFLPRQPFWMGSVAAFFNSLPQHLEPMVLPMADIEEWDETWSDVSAVAFILKQLQADSVMHVANSMSVRYVDALQTMLPEGIELWCNRGLSGIDGTLSTAVGQALADPQRQHVVLIGDLALNYDNNALLSQPFPTNVLVVILNNFGGQIFRNLPGPPAASADVERHFVAARTDTFAWFAQRFGLRYACCGSIQELADCLKNWDGIRTGVIELQTDARENTAAWNTYQARRAASWNEVARGRD
ncbi:MAG: 2-succinyl-5-enolpyruvyl-6-hydroxy-3-cyclohexene-1-carboxylic-acid synthase [Flavobacteriales bacterium]